MHSSFSCYCACLTGCNGPARQVLDAHIAGMQEWWQTLGEQERQSFRQQQEQLVREQFNELQEQQQQRASSSAAGSSYGEYDVSITEGEAATLAVAPPEPPLASSEHDRMQCAPHDAASSPSSSKQMQVGKALSSLVGEVGRSWSCIAAGLRAHAHQRIAQLQARTSCKPGLPQTQGQSGSGVEDGEREAGVDSTRLSPYDQYDKAERGQRARVGGICLLHVQLHLMPLASRTCRRARHLPGSCARNAAGARHARTRQRCCRLTGAWPLCARRVRDLYCGICRPSACEDRMLALRKTWIGGRGSCPRPARAESCGAARLAQPQARC